MSGAELLTTLLKTISDTVLIIDSANRISYGGGGSSWIQLKALRGKTPEAIFSEELALLLTGLFDQCRSGESVQQTELQLSADNAPLLAELGLEGKQWYRISCSKMADKVILALHDISRQKEIEERASHQMHRDSLTGAYNRKALVPVLNQAVAQAQRYEYICSLALIDIDGFNQINERYGWNGGDQILRELVTGITQMKRRSDFLARVGDDQLAMLLPETSRDQSRIVGRRVLGVVKRLAVQSSDGVMDFHVSIGTATIQGHDDSAEDMLRRASENLTIAKQSGGNRIETDEDEGGNY
ncbi:MAG: GGDEF domain-containing protein [Marinobacterium sp.]|nr:GGDEF domain-containing protein [Marinobacterium sp.]